MTNASGTPGAEDGKDVLNMPRPAFQAYVLAQAQYLLSEHSVGDARAASSFLRLLAARAERDPGSVAPVYEKLVPAIGFVAASQPRFDAEREIHGDFGELAAALTKLLHRDPDELTGESQMLDATDDA
jgi:hypothetical protein